MFVRRIRKTIVLVFLLLLPAIVYQLGAMPPEPMEEANTVMGESTNKPIIVSGAAEVRSITDTAISQEKLAVSSMSEDFEGTWPSGSWQLSDNSSSDGGEYFWGRRDCQPHAGTFSGWSVGGGSQGSILDCSAEYPNNAQSWAIYGPFDLSNAAAASLDFYVWGITSGATDCPWDYLFAGSSTDGLSFSGIRYCGDWTNGDDGNGYSMNSLDLSSELGQTQVWVGFLFSSNDSVTNIGFTIDDVVLDINASPGALLYLPVVANPGYPPAFSPTLNDIANSDGDSNYTVSWTSVSEATSYILEEDDNSTFSSPTAVYSGANTSTAISVGGKGTYYYRVKAVNDFGESSWSSSKFVDIIKDPILDDNVPCLLVLAQIFSVYGGFEIQEYCVNVNGAVITVEWRYDPTTGAVNGFDLTIRDNQDEIIYEASIDIERDQFGRIGSYSGAVSGADFLPFNETIINEYDSLGKVIAADVTKVYTESGNTYTMDLTPCPLGDSWSGYQVNVWGGIYSGDLFLMGDCS